HRPRSGAAPRHLRYARLPASAARRGRNGRTMNNMFASCARSEPLLVTSCAMMRWCSVPPRLEHCSRRPLSRGHRSTVSVRFDRQGTCAPSPPSAGDSDLVDAPLRAIAQHHAGAPGAPDVRAEVISGFKRIGADTNLVEGPGTAATKDRAHDARVSTCQNPGIVGRNYRIGRKHTLARESGTELNAPGAVRSKLHALGQLLQ